MNEFDYGHVETPRKKRSGGNPFAIEARLIGWELGLGDWFTRRRYRTEADRDKALAALNGKEDAFEFRPKGGGPVELACPYCGNPAEFWPSSERLYAADHGPVYICQPCQAWVGCHKGTKQPLGGLADKELRHWRRSAHYGFDRLWSAKMRRDGCSKREARQAGYRWLAGQLGIEADDCHIGMFDAETCKRVVKITDERMLVGERGFSPGQPNVLLFEMEKSYQGLHCGQEA